MLLNKRISQEGKERLKSGDINLLRKALDEEMKLLITRLLAEKENIHYYQGAAAFCNALKALIN